MFQSLAFFDTSFPILATGSEIHVSENGTSALSITTPTVDKAAHTCATARLLAASRKRYISE